jgi:nitrogen-specific signal transduction histidine kinase/ActR/RegA family two-component response regulator
MIECLVDITDRKRAEEELQRAEKLESLGILASGIAHDFNNILLSLCGNTQLAAMEAAPESHMAELLAESLKACTRARGLAQQLLTFARGGAPIKKTASIAELIQDCAKFALHGSNVGCDFEIAEQLWPVDIDEGQISQVIHNLVINADQAMPEGGVIKISAENMVIDSDDGAHHPTLEDGDYVRISIQDEGIGIPSEHLTKIFDPYFTTKQRGSGLGLASSYSIVKRHDGHLGVQSHAPVGTTFEVYLPASKASVEPEESEEAECAAGNGKILFMDDEEQLRALAGKLLKHLGYRVEGASDGAEAIEAYRKAMASGEPFAAVILDLTVPGGMGGKAAVKELLEIDPDVVAIVSSGYSNDTIMANYRHYGFSGVIAKPYQLEELAEALHTVTSMKPPSGQG